ncbi:DUF551 domain-containing protein [Acidovorax sp. LjRoot117]|uniref:DUF551 domain-containing protein n=1 Tax=Acidovorax sp. LjRoot117 TaxID=3342255 RepID=UPI003ED069D9
MEHKTDTDAGRAAFEAYLKDCDLHAIVPDVGGAFFAAFQAGRASLAASAGSQGINGQLYTALNNLFSHLGMEGCITSDHAFVWDAMTALKRIDGGVHLDNLAVPVDPDAHRDDMLAAVQLLEAGEWAEHFAKTPIGMRLEDQITKLHNEVAASAGSEPVAWTTGLRWLGTPRQQSETVVKLTREAQPEYGFTVPLFTHPSPPEGMVGGWISVDERLPELYKRVLVITTDCDDEPYATPAHYNGPGKFLATGGHRLAVATHWQEIEAPPAGWKLPPAKPRVSHRRKPAPPIAAGGGKEAT